MADLSRRATDCDALIVLDQALALHLIDRGVACQLHRLGALAEPAESPMETRLRWLLIQAGVPRPQVQAAIPEAHARADLFFADARLIVECDGANHRDRIVDDNRRQNRLVSAGYTVLRFTASDIYNRPDAVVAQVSAAAAASARPPAEGRR